MNNSIVYRIFDNVLTEYGCDSAAYLQKQSAEVLNAEVPMRVSDLTKACVRYGAEREIIVLTNLIPLAELQEYVKDLRYPIVFFALNEGQVAAHVISGHGHSKLNLARITDARCEKSFIDSINSISGELHTEKNEDGETCVLAMTALPNKPIYSNYDEHGQATEDSKKWTLIRKFGLLLKQERREIGYILLYAIIAGVISLSLPLGVQSIVGFVSSGRIATSVVVLIVLIVLGLLIGGGMQIMQLYLAEFIQKRLFAKTAFEFAFRIPRIKVESVLKDYPPELVNRFFEIVTLQKGVATILLEFSAAILQIVFGLLLLSIYHPLFILLGILLLALLVLVFRVTGPRGLETSKNESKYKYKVANWLEELARSMLTFKLLGDQSLAVKRTDHLVSGYLYERTKHFKILAGQYLSFVLFKTLITGGLLIAGCILIVEKEINLGQFIASEIVIILIMGSVEKLILKLDTVYDVLTSIDKIAHVTDLPIDRQGTIVLPNKEKGMHIKIDRLSYRFPDRRDPVLNNVSMEIKPGERVCIAGSNASGKTSLVNIMLGLLDSWEGGLSYDGIPLRNLNRNSLLEQVGDYVAQEELLDGTFLENIAVGRTTISLEKVMKAVHGAGLQDYLNSLPDGLNTRLVGGGMRVPGSISRKIIIARALAGDPRLLLLDDFLLGVEKKEKARILSVLQNESTEQTMVLVSNDPFVMENCERIIFLKNGIVHAQGTYEQLKNDLEFVEVLNSR
jgi:ABC-type branched-subunit amino acid transport system ATPase component